MFTRALSPTLGSDDVYQGLSPGQFPAPSSPMRAAAASELSRWSPGMQLPISPSQFLLNTREEAVGPIAFSHSVQRMLPEAASIARIDSIASQLHSPQETGFDFEPSFSSLLDSHPEISSSPVSEHNLISPDVKMEMPPSPLEVIVAAPMNRGGEKRRRDPEAESVPALRIDGEQDEEIAGIPPHSSIKPSKLAKFATVELESEKAKPIKMVAGAILQPVKIEFSEAVLRKKIEGEFKKKFTKKLSTSQLKIKMLQLENDQFRQQISDYEKSRKQLKEQLETLASRL